ncbi:MAG: helix-turn-helix domain-containing protein [Dokdonella sp.]|uniref:helix-turn-helix domain-containing protein n=1 Tax=Dokdonella sp. TaxID=2291710 RepID=UPI003F7EC680
MDSLITAAARALATGDPLGALKRVALREDAPALALRGLALAQLGDFARAKALLRMAHRAFGPREAVARARCLVAEAEIALVSRELGGDTKLLDAARALLERHGDRANAAHAHHLAIRRLVLLGRIDEAERRLDAVDPHAFTPALRAAHEHVVAGIALRRVRGQVARDALSRAAAAAREAGIASLATEIGTTARLLDEPAARLVAGGSERVLRLGEVEALQGSDAFVVDACRHLVRAAPTSVPLATRPVLFALARELARAWPGDVARSVLIERVFRTRHGDESHRARLRVEIGRLRAALRGLADIMATKDGFALAPVRARDVVVLLPPLDAAHGDVLALLADGEAWSSSALALALGVSARTVQRALDVLAAEAHVQPVGHGRARRWMTPPVPGFPTLLLLTLAPGGD